MKRINAKKDWAKNHDIKINHNKNSYKKERVFKTHNSGKEKFKNFSL